MSTQDRLNLALARKAELETAQLADASDASPRLVRLIAKVTPASGLVLAFLAVLSACGSVAAWVYTEEKNRNEALEARVQDSIRALAATTAQQRITAISEAGGLLGKSAELDKEILSALSHVMIVESSSYVRTAVNDLFRSLPAETDAAALRDALHVLLNEDRELSVGIQPMRHGIVPLSSESQEKLTPIKAMIESLVHAHVLAHNFSRTNLTDMDFSNAELRAADFDDAILNGARFDGADLDEAHFVNASFNGATFIRAKMHSARMSNFDGQHNVSDWIIGNLDADWQWKAPDFRCADLTGANLSGSFIAQIISDSEHRYFRDPSNASFFEGARLDGASFYDVWTIVFTAKAGVKPDSDDYTMGWSRLLADQVDPDDQEIVMPDYSRARVQLAMAFAGSSWRKARMPRRLKHFLGVLHPENLITSSAWRSHMCDRTPPDYLYARGKAVKGD